ncbi:hypothetical protein GCM10010123_24760 [Pilimelia anulata]|uniref:Pyrrolo-quinoline quinone repeat domain-containing protein n=1 Tax=Pilimelia anulata TaxID=53371 RepID=A0A8J3B6Y6_9ACTN|nr:PQQ-binding-like beta-propeller repeat protein [Pilimelia anulata]GGJ93962.1 hypothetical protein GCM10010123_24760 [Pilimelia anulata]
MSARGTVRLALLLLLVAALTTPAAAAAGPAGPTAVWRVDLPYADARSPIVAAGDALFVACRDAVVALDARTGAERWRHPVTVPWTARLAAEGRHVALAYSVASRSHEVRVLDARTGAAQWSRRLGIVPVLLTAPGMIIVDVDKEAPMGETHRAFRSTDGTPLWTAEDLGHHARVVGRRLVGDDRAIELATGAVAWTATAFRDLKVFAVSPDGRRATGTARVAPDFADAVVRVDGANGTVRWRSAGRAELAAGHDDGRRVYLASSPRAGSPRVTAQDAGTGAPLWSRPGRAYQDLFGFGMFTAGGRLHVHEDLFCHTADPATGAERPTPVLDGGCEDALTAADLVIYRDADRITAHPAATGR